MLFLDNRNQVRNISDPMKCYCLLGWTLLVSSNCTIRPRPRKSSLLAIYPMAPFFISCSEVLRGIWLSFSRGSCIVVLVTWVNISLQSCDTEGRRGPVIYKPFFIQLNLKILSEKKKKELMSCALKNNHPVLGMQPSLGWPPCPLAKSMAGRGGDGSCLNAQEYI